MFAKLNLSDAQKASMKQIRESFGERTKSLREQLGPSARSCVRRITAVRSMKHLLLRI